MKTTIIVGNPITLEINVQDVQINTSVVPTVNAAHYAEVHPGILEHPVRVCKKGIYKLGVWRPKDISDFSRRSLIDRICTMRFYVGNKTFVAYPAGVHEMAAFEGSNYSLVGNKKVGVLGELVSFNSLPWVASRFVQQSRRKFGLMNCSEFLHSSSSSILLGFREL